MLFPVCTVIELGSEKGIQMQEHMHIKVFDIKLCVCCVLQHLINDHPETCVGPRAHLSSLH